MTQTSSVSQSLKTGKDVRLFARSGTCPSTSGLAPGYLQGNLIILPLRYAADFRLLCERNPVPCPLIAESAATGVWSAVKSYLPGVEAAALISDVDLRRDAPKYNVYIDSKLAVEGCDDIVSQWTDDHVAFVIGCSFSFEAALATRRLTPLHTELGRNVPMYRTVLPLCPAGVFQGSTFVVSMRPYPAAAIETIRDITRAYTTTHGEPIAWGWESVRALGIVDIDKPDWGDAPLNRDGSRLGRMEGSDEMVPVFWGCGVTPQEAVMKAGLEGTIMAHSPGFMLLLDCQDIDLNNTGHSNSEKL